MLAEMGDTDISARPTVLDCLHGIVDGQVTSAATAYLEAHPDSPKSEAMKVQFKEVRTGLELMRTHWDKLPTLVFLADMFARPTIIKASDRAPGQLNMRQAFLARTGLEVFPVEGYFPSGVTSAPKTSNFGQHCRIMHWAWHNTKRIRTFMTLTIYLYEFSMRNGCGGDRYIP